MGRLVCAFVVRIQLRFSRAVRRQPGSIYKIVYQAGLIEDVASKQILNIINVYKTRPAITLNQDSLLQENALFKITGS